MSKELVFGHSNPDTDAIVAAKAYAYYVTKKEGAEVEAVALGTPNAETEFVFDHFQSSMPRKIETAANEVESVMLVDHNEFQQSVSDIKDVTISHVIDHHRIANFETAAPLFYRAEPVGCTSTIITELFNESEIEIPSELAGLMASAIISDTLLLKSPTTTQFDRDALAQLAKIANLDIEEYGIAMLKAGTNIASKSVQDIINGDAKSFEMAGKTVRIGQVNTVDVNDVYARQDQLVTEMKKDSKDNGYDLFLLVATNILDSDSELLVVGEPKETVEKAFDVKLDTNNRAALVGVVSRKKQVVPPLMDAFNA